MKTDSPRRRLTVNPRLAIVALHDVTMAALSLQITLGFRLAFDARVFNPIDYWEATAIFTFVAAAVFARAGLYRGIWHYASFRDLVAISKAVTLTILIFLPLLFLVTRLEDFPRAVLLLEWPLLVTMLIGPRLAYRAFKDGNLRRVFDHHDDRVPVLLVGAGQAAETFIRDMARRKTAGYRVVGLVDDKSSRRGRDIHGVRVMGDVDSIPDVVARLERSGLRPHRLIASADNIDSAAMRRLFDIADELGLTLARLPRLTDFRGGETPTADVRPIDVEDLLGRPQKVLDRAAIRRLVAGRRVLVTGAGGTIGSELARQVANLDPSHLVLLDNGEHNLYQIDMELAEAHPDLPRRALLADVRDQTRLDAIFREQSPDLVFHAAAFKHVPLSEANPLEAIRTNALGTRAVADACLTHGVGAMVLISTDKAVNPSSIMGASKRVAELVCQALSLAEAKRRGATRFVTVRFGNVLGSTGSVVPLFQRQLARGGPLTVTHPDMTRYFMTTREAVALVLQATAMTDADGDAAEPGRIFVLDMGEPVRILDLARQMIRLAGLRPDTDVPIVFTGLRPGEKLREELLHVAERLVATRQEGILLAAPRVIDRRELYAALDQLQSALIAQDDARARALLARLVPEFSGAAPPEAPANVLAPPKSTTARPASGALG
jgi:FlaA1/EpsC-like NDP-sugar epimerase